MRFLARQVSAAASKKRLASQRPPHRPLIAVLRGHALLQQFPQHPGNTGIPPRRLNAGPLRHVLFQSDGDITELMFRGHENSVTRDQCLRERTASTSKHVGTDALVRPPGKARQPRNCYFHPWVR
jgi:hypothetical protein